MRLVKSISIAAFSLAMSGLTVPAAADVVSVSCSWQVTSQNGGGSSFYINDVCKTSAGATVASRNRQYNANVPSSCTLNISSPYFKTGGTCESPSFGTETSPPKQCLRPGSVWGTYRVGQYATPAPSQSTLDSYCGYGCANNYNTISTDQYGAVIQITCGSTTN